MMVRPLAQHAAPWIVLLLVVLAAAQVTASPMARGDFKADFKSFLSGPALVGSFQLVEEEGVTYLEFGASFKAQKGPDLRIFLSKRSPESVTGDNAVNGSVRLGLLHEFTGSQRYRLPADVDLTEYSTVIVHCEAYSKLWGAGQLTFNP